MSLTFAKASLKDRLSCTAGSFSLPSKSSLDPSRSIRAPDALGVPGTSSWLSCLLNGKGRFVGGLPPIPSTSVRSQRSRIVRFVERGVCGDDWIEEPEGTSFPPRKLKLSTTTRTTARDWSFDVAPQTFAVATIRVWFVRNGNLAQRFGSISQASPYGELGLWSSSRRLPPGSRMWPNDLTQAFINIWRTWGNFLPPTLLASVKASWSTTSNF